jgi:hypothetical protein
MINGKYLHFDNDEVNRGREKIPFARPWYFPTTETIKSKSEKSVYNILNYLMKPEEFNNDPYVPGWVKGAVHTAERIGMVAVVGLFMAWLSVTLLTRDDARNDKFLMMANQTSLTLQELTVAVHELKVTVEQFKK